MERELRSRQKKTNLAGSFDSLFLLIARLGRKRGGGVIRGIMIEGTTVS